MMWAVVGTTPFETYDKLTLTFRHTGTCLAANAKQAFRPAWCADLPVHSLLDWHWSFQMMWAVVGTRKRARRFCDAYHEYNGMARRCASILVS